eukprot:1195413-Prorocentrum_minimum.AAC.3
MANGDVVVEDLAETPALQGQIHRHAVGLESTPEARHSAFLPEGRSEAGGPVGPAAPVVSGRELGIFARAKHILTGGSGAAGMVWIESTPGSGASSRPSAKVKSRPVSTSVDHLSFWEKMAHSPSQVIARTTAQAGGKRQNAMRTPNARRP